MLFSVAVAGRRNGIPRPPRHDKKQQRRQRHRHRADDMRHRAPAELLDDITQRRLPGHRAQHADALHRAGQHGEARRREPVAGDGQRADERERHRRANERAKKRRR